MAVTEEAMNATIKTRHAVMTNRPMNPCHIWSSAELASVTANTAPACVPSAAVMGTPTSSRLPE